MPKLYEYFGLILLFYSNDHYPIHVHGKYQGKESKKDDIVKKWIDFFVLNKEVKPETINNKLD